MTLSLAHVTFDCADAAALAEFWAQLLEHPVDPDPNPYFATVGRSVDVHPILMFIQVPDKTPGKNTLHLDLRADDFDEQIARAVHLGATHVADFHEYGIQWATLRDPEGNLFDIGKAEPAA